jgi:hypothetical protein
MKTSMHLSPPLPSPPHTHQIKSSLHNTTNGLFHINHKPHHRRVISGFRREVAKNCALMGYYAAGSGNFLPTFGTTYRSHPQGSRIKFLDSWTLKMGPIGCPETSARNYRYSLLNTPADGRSLSRPTDIIQTWHDALLYYKLTGRLHYDATNSSQTCSYHSKIRGKIDWQ